ncbi:peptidylprolyl isomerase [Pseudomonas sp. BIGb0427]|uniref:peptidylprolyl isomerase n=1 Tax=unclassified Pseudomonas TaxID=196821 RepID=UPI0018A71AD6|nr:MULTISPECIES: peptidylprolyl isomerase [unclassified Pseudomonas]QPG62316.1 peptidylprolyl isomerase [Pseudomonas sp. BIGb0427]UVM64667.1 peptidylprolyl isomerase [Pseudomonas sp. B21-009]
MTYASEAHLIASSEQQWPVISVNDVVISQQALAQELQYHPAKDREEAVYMAARALVIRELMQQRIAELGLALQVGAGENPEEAATRLLLEREVQVPSCDEATCLRYYHSNRGRFHSAPLLAVRHILLECAPDDAEARSLALVQAEILHERLLQFPEQFAELAQKYSACPSKAQGGELGQISKGQTVPELERQLFTLAPGLALKPLESRYGWHLVSVDQRIEGQALPYEAVATAIRTQLQQGVWQKALVQYLQTLIGAADIRGIRLQGADSPLVQ